MNTRVLKNEFLQIEYRTDALRIVGLSFARKPNLLADVSDQPPVSTPYGDFRFLGGHRLWHSPEAMPRSYLPDDDISVSETPDGVVLEGKTEPGAGIRKRIEIRLAADKPSVTLTHTLINDGLWAVELAPWAITQFRLGGTAILPMPVGNVDAAGLLPNRQFSFWAYSQINDPRLRLGDGFTFFEAKSLPPFKMGYFNSRGWLAYWVDGILFRKTFGAQAGAAYPDNGCNAEMYCNERFVELESLAPLVKLAPGAEAAHAETWDLFDGLESLPDEIRQVVVAL